MNRFDLLNDQDHDVLKNISQVQMIDGWLYLQEAVKLFKLVKDIKSERPVVCEIGVWKGKSSYVLASALKGTKGVLYCIDPFSGDGDDASKDDYQAIMRDMNKSLLENFKETMTLYNLSEYIRIIPKLSEQARLNFPESKIDLLFIDGNHTYEAVKRDYDLYSPLLVSGGVIVLHDVGANHVNGPSRVMYEEIVNNSKWKNPDVVGTAGIAVKV